MPGKKVVVIGELNVDLIASGLERAPSLGQEVLVHDFQIALGSASAIFACGAAKLGNEVTFISEVGDDEFGRFCLSELERQGISAEHIIKTLRYKTGVTISLSMDHDRALITYLGAISRLEYEEIPQTILEGHDHLHLTSYFLQSELQPMFSVLMDEAKRYGLSVSFDPNADPAQEWKEDIWQVLETTDILFVNESEARRLAKCHDVTEVLKTLGQTVPCVVIKLGPKGAVARRGRETAFAPGFEVTAIDTTGAGDSFAAGFIHAYLESMSLKTCLEFGNACGALSATKVGGTEGQPDRILLERFLQGER